MKPPSQRILYLDWVRGFAALIMLQGHVFQSFLRNDLRGGGPYMSSQFLGGMPPAVFLFLLGVTFAFLMDSQQRKGVSPAGRWRAAMKRSGYLFAVAFAFRLQLWLFSFNKNTWTDLLRVDILNCMGLALLILSVMSVFRTEERIRLCAILGVAIAAAAPLVSSLDWSGTPALVRSYIIPDHNFFGFFPWAAFVAFGMSAGSILRLLKPEDVPVAMQWFGWGGLATAFAAYAMSSTPLSIYSASDFWLNGPSLIFIKLGAILILIAFAWLWNIRTTAQDWSWVRQFGLTSLLVYWVHVELVYGRWFGVLKENLTVGQTVFSTVVTILLMLGLSLIRTNWAQVRSYFASSNAVAARRFSGD
ncbi:MAG TPA: heparan-alpha-glucosaminide N-acetyltransferase domain-containing protein [Bryobacteraceae bacterium]|nr:heparan-alpha-glucosaminide N-acetyltransferase domain-containing protein [Bryobacteraceae bacterium]